MATFDSDGLNIHYDIEGEGSPVILVHGFAASAEANWRAPGWIDHLIDCGRQVISLDCRGHGKSDKPYNSSAYNGDVMSDDVIRLMDHLELKKADLMGYSMGARIGAGLLKSHSDRFNSVVLGGMGGSIFSNRAERDSNISGAMISEDKSSIENPLAKGFREFAESTGADLKALAAVMGAERATLNPSDLSHVSIPVLIVVGDKDDLVGDPQPLADAIPDSELVVLKDRDHLTAVADAEYKRVVKRFLA